jgi:hypothetical protein
MPEVVPVATTPEHEPAAWVPGQGGPAERLTADELARRLGVQPVRDVAELLNLARPELWDSEEEYEEFLADLYASRRAGMS